MLQQNFQPNEAQYHASGEGRLALKGSAELLADAHPRQRQDARCTANYRDCRQDRHLEKSKGNAYRHGVDAGSHRQHQQLLPAEMLLCAGLLVLVESVPDHFTADKPQQNESDPVIDVGNIAFKLTAQQPAQHGHRRLKEAEGFLFCENKNLM